MSTFKWDALGESKKVPSLVPAAVTGTVTGVVIDGTDCAYITHEIEIGAITTQDSGDNLVATINESDKVTNSTTLSGGTALPAAAVLGVEYVQGGTFGGTTTPPSFPIVSLGTTLPTFNNATTYPSGTIARINTLKNKNYQQLVLTATGSPSLLLAASALLSGYGISPTV